MPCRARLGLDAVPLACAAGWTVMLVWELSLVARWKRKGLLTGHSA